MFTLQLTEDDKDWLQKRYPDLSIKSEKDVLVVVGVFTFDAVYNSCRISDSYDVQIELKANALSTLPRVRETSSRIKQVAKSRKYDLADLHSYTDGTACLCVKPEEKEYFPDDFCFQKFVEELVVPFFYAQSFFEKNGSWPWETYSHGSLGWLEWYFDQETPSLNTTKEFVDNLHSQYDWKKIRRALTRKGGVKSHRACLCGSTKSYLNCHQKAFKGLQRLMINLKVFGIKD